MSNARTRRRPPTKKPVKAPLPARRKLPIGWIAGGVAAVALIAAVVLSLDGGSDDVVSEFGSPAVEGTALPVSPDGAADPAIGMPIPAVTGASFDGTPTSIEPADGPTAIVFMAHWCPHCQNEAPVVQGWMDSGVADDLGVTFRSVATGTSSERANYPPSAWLAREGWTVPVVVDDAAGSVASAFGLSAFPYWVITDADGNVTARRTGSVSLAEIAALTGSG